MVTLGFDDRRDLRDPRAEEFSVHKGSSRYLTTLSGLPSPTKPGRVYRRVPQVCERIRQVAYGHRESLHLQAGDVVADQVPADSPAVAADVGVDLIERAVELDQRGAATAVDKNKT